MRIPRICARGLSFVLAQSYLVCQSALDSRLNPTWDNRIRDSLSGPYVERRNFYHRSWHYVE